eukprot:TRINITY_DN10078_c0_g1_i3.p1 TRINITY_DN10078_c0_g1~~TRINITY_DN10078_c0_g1_i3.p1  ORF type:complete len:114 (+),score=27.30 TRINITY_DN10078_c0_g1_i3:312-653(+)
MQHEMKSFDGVGETLSQFWRIPDPFTYDNIGSCRAGPGDDFKYLTCAECEYEPIGVQTIGAQDSLLCHTRVVYDDPATTAGHRQITSEEAAGMGINATSLAAAAQAQAEVQGE